MSTERNCPVCGPERNYLVCGPEDVLDREVRRIRAREFSESRMHAVRTIVHEGAEPRPSEGVAHARAAREAGTVGS